MYWGFVCQLRCFSIWTSPTSYRASSPLNYLAPRRFDIYYSECLLARYRICPHLLEKIIRGSH